MSDDFADERELTLENDYKHLCEFEMPQYEKINLDSDGSIVLTVDKDLFLNLDNSDVSLNETFEPVRYSSYNSLFNKRYKNSFKRNLNAINYKTIESELGKDTLSNITRKDKELRELYNEITKERDLDNDGVPDRIDIDDTRNSVQSVKDLGAVRNSTSASTERHNKKQERQIKKEDSIEMNL